jgi:hypothetical protein
MNMRCFAWAFVAVVLTAGCNQQQVQENPPAVMENPGISTINCRCREQPHTFGPNDEATLSESCDNPDNACNKLCNARGWGNGSLSYGGICMMN